jgi:hypothetical protein
MHPMNRTQLLTFVGILILGFALSASAQQTAKGYVFGDLNRNGKKDRGEIGISGIAVSNQIEITLTDADGNWELPVRDDCIFFVIKPTGWMTPLDHHNLPKFYYIHKPAGSPDLKYKGLPPTGALPDSIEFPLYPQKEPNQFKALFFGDPQPRDQRELDFIAHDVIEDLIGSDAKFGVTLGDILFDDLSLFENNNALIALIGIPWYNVIGNHDINFDAASDRLSDETFERYYGPSYYAYSYGPVHFIVLDNIDWGGSKPDGTGSYTGGLGKEQLTFIENLMPHIPENELIMLLMHIPVYNTKDAEKLYRLIEDRPYSLSISGHTHWHAHRFLGKKEGWQGKKPHHHVVNVTVSGSWWSGEPDENGIPHSTGRDGAPNGHTIINFDGTQAVIDFKAARRPADYQMNVIAPEQVARNSDKTELVYVNVFNGSEKSKVQIRVGSDGDWITLKKVFELDPSYVALKESEKGREKSLLNRPLSAPVNSYHLWKFDLPQIPQLGVHRLWVRTEDMYGRTFNASRTIRVVETLPEIQEEPPEKEAE